MLWKKCIYQYVSLKNSENTLDKKIYLLYAPDIPKQPQELDLG